MVQSQQDSYLKVDLSLAGEDCQHAVTDKSLCPVTGCALGADVCHWMFKTKVNMVQGQEDGPLSIRKCFLPDSSFSLILDTVRHSARNVCPRNV